MSQDGYVPFKVGDIVVNKYYPNTYTVLEVSESKSELRVKSRTAGDVEWSGDVEWRLMADFEIVENVELSETKSENLIDHTLQERGSRYGSFNDLAQISQALKDTMRATDGWTRLSASQREALEMVQHKIARMLNGDPTYEDNAVDIVGYSTLMMKNMQGDLKI